GRADQRRAGPAAVHIAEAGRRTRVEHPAQARRDLPGRGGRGPVGPLSTPPAIENRQCLTAGRNYGVMVLNGSHYAKARSAPVTTLLPPVTAPYPTTALDHWSGADVGCRG